MDPLGVRVLTTWGPPKARAVAHPRTAVKRTTEEKGSQKGRQKANRRGSQVDNQNPLVIIWFLVIKTNWAPTCWSPTPETSKTTLDANLSAHPDVRYCGTHSQVCLATFCALIWDCIWLPTLVCGWRLVLQAHSPLAPGLLARRIVCIRCVNFNHCEAVR